MAALVRVPVDDRALLVAEVGHREAVDEAQAPGPRDAGERVAQRGEVRLVQPVAVDAAHAARDDDDLDGRAHDHRVELVARLGVVLLGVVERGERPDLADAEGLDVEEHGRGDERAGEASAPGLVGARDPAHAQAAVELEEATPGAALGPRAAAAGAARPGGAARRARRARPVRREPAWRAEATTGSAAGSVTTAITVTAAPADRAGRPRRGARAGAAARPLEEADALGRPVGREGAADDPFARDRAPEAAVVGLATVVAHHEPVVGRDGDRGCEVAAAAVAGLAACRLM